MLAYIDGTTLLGLIMVLVGMFGLLKIAQAQDRYRRAWGEEYRRSRDHQRHVRIMDPPYDQDTEP